jgi:hypothetical protein
MQPLRQENFSCFIGPLRGKCNIANPFTSNDRDSDVVFKSTAREVLIPQDQGNFDWSLSELPTVQTCER